MMRAALLLALGSLLLAGCSEEGQWTLSLSVFATNATPTTGATWELDETHDFEWDGGDTDTWEIGCSVADDGLEQTFTFHARDELWQQGMELSMILSPYEGNGTYELWPDEGSPPFDLSLSTIEQTYDLETRSTGRCTVIVADEQRFGDFSCDQIMEDVVADHQQLPFTVTGSWECAEIITGG